MELVEFLRTVITAEKGWFCLARAKILADEKQTKESWNEQFFSWPDELSSIVDRIRNLSGEYDVYFSPYLFSEQASLKDLAIPGRTIVADLDEADILTIQLKPTILVETSEGRHQGYWILKEALDNEKHEQLSKQLTYSIPRCDKSGWFLGKKVRVPETYNRKYVSGPQYIRVVDDGGRIYGMGELEHLVTINEMYGEQKISFDEDLSWIETALNQEDGPQELLSRIRNSIPTVVAKYNIESRDRSAALWALMMALFRAGMSRDKIFFIAYHSPNNKFKDLRYGGLRELGKDVLRAELATKMLLPDIKTKITNARKLGDDAIDRMNYISKLVREHLDKLGSFIHASDDSAWYIRNDTGRPIIIGSRSEHLLRLLESLFGINAAQKESSYVNHHLDSMVADLPITGKLATLSYYEHNMRMFMLHTGRKDILVVTKDGIKREINGYQGIIFPWATGNSVISPEYRMLDRPWEDELFEDCLDNIVGISKDNAKAILKVWLLTVLLRDGLVSRPILALYGMPGSGKSTLFRRIYTLIYGRERGLNSVSKEEHFDHAMARDALVVLDNVDTYAKWLPDRLAVTISPTEIIKRKLFTDSDTIVLRRQAMLGITAHDPKFTRVDVTDRLLLLNFERLQHFKPENQILERIESIRGGLWGSILQDIQSILEHDVPRTGFPQFRIEDFAQFGYWIATSLGIGQEFYNGIEEVRKSQRSMNLEEDVTLIMAIDKYLSRENGRIEDMGAGMLWQRLKVASGDERAFDRKYGNAVSLARKLWTLLETLKEVFEVDWRVERGSRVWTIRKRIEVGTNGHA